MFYLWYTTILFGVLTAFLFISGLILSTANTLIKHKKFINSFSFFLAISIALMLFFVFFLFCSIFLPKVAQRELKEYMNDKATIEQFIIDGKDLNSKEAKPIIARATNWYNNAKSRNEEYGNWSKYFQIDFNNVEPIVLK